MNLVKDLNYAWRMLKSHPGFTAVAAVSLGLGIGLNTALFSVVNAVLIRPLPVEKPGELVAVFSDAGEGFPHAPMSYPDYLDLKNTNTVFSDMAGHALTFANLSHEGRSELVLGEIVTGNYFDLLGVKAHRGRTLQTGEDDARGSAAVAILGHGFWQRRFGADPEILGRTLKLNGQPFEVVGVVEPAFGGTVAGFAPDVWVSVRWVDELEPIMQDVEGSSEGDSRLEQRGNRWMLVKGRLAPGASLKEARAQIGTLMAGLAAEYPDTNEERQARLEPASEIRIHPMIDRALSPVAGLLLGVVGLVLLVACANVANMLLARASARRREIAVRLALGASRWRLFRQLLVESGLLAAMGGALGLLLAYGSNRLLGAYRPDMPVAVTLDLSLDARVLLFTLAVSLATGLIFGLVPALQASRPDVVPALKGGGEERLRGRSRLGGLLVVSQVALSLILLVGAGLLVRGLVAARAIDLGFEHQRLGAVGVDLDMNGYDEAAGRSFWDQALERVRALPGVETATLAARIPLSFSMNMTGVSREARQTGDREPDLIVDVVRVGDDYFETLGLPIVQGRRFDGRDREDSPPVAIVNQTLAERLWPGEDPIGKPIYRDPEDPPLEVVGVVRDYKVHTVGEAPRPYLHLARSQGYSQAAVLLFRSHGDAAKALEMVLRELRALDPELVFLDDTTLTRQMATRMLPARAGAALLGGFSGLAVLLAALGLYGLIAYWVTQRRREIGIRMALGAESSRVLRLVVGRGMRLVIIGVVVGLLGALATGRLLAGVLYGVSPTDPLTFTLCGLLLLAVALLANALPAWRAAHLDPATVLRHE